MNLQPPEGGGGVGGHAPVAAGREADAAHFRAVGHARALELLIEEAVHKGVEPFLDRFGAVSSVEGVERQAVDALGGEAVAQHVVEEEVVELVGAHEVLGLLGDVALGIGGD